MKTDLRRWIEEADAAGEVKNLEGADWDREIGTLVELNAKARGPALLFDKVNGYPKGFRLLAGSMSTAKRLSLTLGLPADIEGLDLIRVLKSRMHEWTDHMGEYPPATVEAGGVLENVDVDDAVDLLKFPVPLWHEEDGGRYIGTGSMVIMRDPDSVWVDLGTYVDVMSTLPGVPSVRQHPPVKPP